MIIFQPNFFSLPPLTVLTQIAYWDVKSFNLKKIKLAIDIVTNWK